MKPDFLVKSGHLPGAKFPMILTDTTPEKIVSEFEAMSGVRLYLDKKAGLLSGEEPPGLLERLEHWWRGNRSRWGF